MKQEEKVSKKVPGYNDQSNHTKKIEEPSSEEKDTITIIPDKIHDPSKNMYNPDGIKLQ